MEPTLPVAVAGRSMDPQFSLLQARLSHEDDLINQRVSWLVNSQSFLLTAYAITLNGLAADASKPLAIVQRKLLNLLPLVGVACVLLVCVALIGGLCALGELRRFAVNRKNFRTVSSCFPVNCVSKNIEDTSECLFSNRY